MSEADDAGITSVQLKMISTASSYEINQHLQKGTYRLIIVAPFDTKIAVTPLNPPLGLQFQADMDAATEIWNSLLVTPREDQYTFLVKVNQPIENEPLHVQFLFQSPVSEPPPGPPAPPAPPPPPAAPPPAAPPGDMQEHYRRLGYTIGGQGAVEFWYVAFRTSKATQQREICLNGNISWSVDLHDPARTMRQFPQQDATYVYGRLGPFPTRGQAEASAIQLATQIFADPTRYGIWIVSGTMRQPTFS